MIENDYIYGLIIATQNPKFWETMDLFGIISLLIFLLGCNLIMPLN